LSNRIINVVRGGALSAAIACAVAAVPAAAGPSLVVELESGRVVSQEEPFRRWYPASLSKLMTAYVAFRAIWMGEVTLDSPVRISSNAAKEPPSKMGYAPGSVLTLDNALKIIMVKSANDVATAIAESIAGSQSAFAGRMNAESQRLGMTGSHWVNAHGLHDDEQYSTARDLAILTMAIRTEFPEYARYFQIEGILAGKVKMKNHNTLIGRFDGADGMKTGFTCPAGFNLVATATRDRRTLLAVVVGERSADERAARAADLLANGFSANISNAPRLASLKPSGKGLTQAKNMRPEICVKTAQKGSDDEEERITKSDYLSEMTRPHRFETVALGGATGPLAPAAKEVDIPDRVPTPTPRPNYAPTTASSGTSAVQ
jgi:D-alanyl-D-alanine carboxypeptidase